MSDLFLDSSAIAKRYLFEPGSRWVRELVRHRSGRQVWLSRITEVEIASACARQVREGQLAPSDRDAIRSAVASDLANEYRLVDLTVAVVNRATGLLDKHPLRAYDAVQLASALVLADQLVCVAGLRAPLFISADERLLAAATAEGLATDNPLDHP